MMWLFHRQVAFQSPPCICDQVESHVREAIAMRDEMARWKTPLEEWLALQVMPVLKLKSESAPKPVEDVWATKYGSVFYRSMQASTTTRGVFVHSGTSARDLAPPPWSGLDSSISSLAILPSDGDVIVGSILKRGNGWYKVVSVGHDRMTVQRYY